MPLLVVFFLCLFSTNFLLAHTHKGLILSNDSQKTIFPLLNDIHMPRGCHCDYAALRYPLHITLTPGTLRAAFSKDPEEEQKAKTILCQELRKMKKPFDVEKVEVFSKNKKKAWVVLLIKEEEWLPHKAHVSLYKCKKRNSLICATELEAQIKEKLKTHQTVIKGKALRLSMNEGETRSTRVISEETCR